MRKPIIGFGLIVLTAALSSAIAGANSTAVATEEVCIYNGTTCTGSNNLTNSPSDISGFIEALVQFNNSYSFSWQTAWADSNVFDSDFVDVDLSAHGEDSFNFDQPGYAISYFVGHGTSDDGYPPSATQCETHAECTCPNPPSCGTYEQGTCRHQPGEVYAGSRYGYCAYPTDRFIIVNGSTHPYNNDVDYTGGLVAWGESPNSGGWRHAGTNGGTNLAVLDLSNGVEPDFFINNLLNAFGGVHMIATLMPTGGDTANVPDRGYHFAYNYAINNNGNVADAWTTSMLSLASGDGGSCGMYGVTNGGFDGFNGCGCNVLMTAGANATEANNHREELWPDIQNDSKDGLGAGYMEWTWVCNYNTTTDPWSLP